MTYIEVNGLVIDDEDGEIFDAPDGMDGLLYAAVQLAEAKAQIKAWEQVSAVLQQVFLRDDVPAKGVYGDVVVSVRQGSHPEIDLPTLHEWMADTDLAPVDWFSLAFAATRFDLALLSDAEHLTDAIRRNTHKELHKRAVYVDRVRKTAPALTVRPDIEEEIA